MKTAVIVIALFALSLVFIASLELLKAPAIDVVQPAQSDACSADSDCVPATCCHATACVPASQAPDCSGTACTLSCDVPLDCGGAKCACNQGKCAVEVLEGII
jgi:hypothetical protein